MDNPFVYGEVVPGEAFVDREPELDRLIADLGNGQKVFLISPRRYGKSSLIRQALEALRRRGALTIEVTVSSYSSYLAFLEGYARAIAAVDRRALCQRLQHDVMAGNAAGAGNQRVGGQYVAEQHRLREGRLFIGLAVLEGEQRDRGGRVLLLGCNRGERAGRTAADHEDAAHFSPGR